VIVEQQEVEQVAIADTNGDQHIAGATVTTLVADPTGAKRVVTTKTIVRADDLRLIDPTKEQVFACSCGCNQRLLTSHSVRFCEQCQAPVRLDHTKAWNDGKIQLTVCPACHARRRTARALLRFWRWLTNL
jgi:hypothetical protein